MLVCPRCHTTEPGKSSYSVCEGCGGKMTVFRDHISSEPKERTDDPQELIFGEDKKKSYPRQNDSFSSNRKAANERFGLESKGAVYGESNLHE